MTDLGSLFPPPGYRRWREGPHEAVAWEPVADLVAQALEEGGLAGWASRNAERVAPRASGRGAVYAVRLGSDLAAVRHYRRGGWMAPLGDRYFDRPPRSFVELATSEAARAAGIATPRVLTATVTTTGLGYRADLATEWLEPGHDLAELLVPNLYPQAVRGLALGAAGEAIGRAHRVGLDHADLNLANVFVLPQADGGWAAALLDLDRARIVEPSLDFKKKTFAGSVAPSRRRAARAARAGPRSIGTPFAPATRAA